VACLVVAFLSCAGHVNAQTPSRPEALLRKMTLDEKIGQLVQRAGGRSKALNSRLDDAELARVRAGGVGSYLHVAGAEPLAKLQKVAVEESRLGIPLLFAMDVVHGYRTIFPVPLAMASSWAPELQELAARIAADEATSAGLHWTFAPMVDIARDPRWGRIVEGAGEDPYLGSRMAVAQVAGYQGGNALRPGSLMATAWICSISPFIMNNAAMTRPARSEGVIRQTRMPSKPALNPNNNALTRRVPRNGSSPNKPKNARTEEKPGGKCVTGSLPASQASRYPCPASKLRAPAMYAIESSESPSPSGVALRMRKIPMATSKPRSRTEARRGEMRIFIKDEPNKGGACIE
jgi:hypothetical protein